MHRLFVAGQNGIAASDGGFLWRRMGYYLQYSRQLAPWQIWRELLLLAAMVAGNCAALTAQAPTDEWRRGGFDAMVAQPGGASSMLANPAGIKSGQTVSAQDLKAREKHYEWLADVISAEMFLSGETWSGLANPSSLVTNFTSVLSILPGFYSLLKGEEISGDFSILQFLRQLDGPTYNRMREPVIFKEGSIIPLQETGLPVKPKDLRIHNIKNMNKGQRLALAANLNMLGNEDISENIAELISQAYGSRISGIGLESYVRALALSHVSESESRAWGFYFGLEQKAYLHTAERLLSKPLSISLNRPVNIDTGNLTLEKPLAKNLHLPIEVSVAFQAYVAAPLRFAFASDFDQALPGLTFGLGLKIVPYLGMNQTTWGNFIGKKISAEDGLNWSEEMLTNSLISSNGINLGFDLGLQYHFGALAPQLNFLYAGLKISDVFGFNVPLFYFPGLGDTFADNGDKFRYALDFDWGLYAEHKFPKHLQIFGGFEMIQLRGLVLPEDRSPYSALLEPLDHLRFLFGLGLFDNKLRFTMQYYNSNFSPGLMLNLGAMQLQAMFNLNSADVGAWGLEVGLRFRGGHTVVSESSRGHTYRKFRPKNEIAREKIFADKVPSEKMPRENPRAQTGDRPESTGESKRENTKETVLNAELPQIDNTGEQENIAAGAARDEANDANNIAEQKPPENAPEENSSATGAQPKAPAQDEAKPKTDGGAKKNFNWPLLLFLLLFFTLAAAFVALRVAAHLSRRRDKKINAKSK